MHALRMASALLSIDDADVDDVALEANRRRAARITGAMPALVAHQHRLRRGEDIFEPPEHLGVAAGYLYMLEGREPEPARVDALNAYMVAVIDHGMNASTFTGRVIASTASDMVSAVTGAVCALKGPLHGGVPGPVLDMLQAIGRPEAAEAWVRSAMERGERIMGFGHRVYKVRDPRAEVLATAAVELADPTSRELLDLTREVERVTVKVLGELKPGRDLYANVELYAALVLHAIGIPAEIFTPTFAVARTAGGRRTSWSNTPTIGSSARSRSTSDLGTVFSCRSTGANRAPGRRPRGRGRPIPSPAGSRADRCTPGNALRRTTSPSAGMARC